MDIDLEYEFEQETNKCMLDVDCTYSGSYIEWLEKKAKQLITSSALESLQDLPKCTRVEVIDKEGRSYVNFQPTNKVKLSMQDDGRTVKIFID